MLNSRYLVYGHVKAFVPCVSVIYTQLGECALDTHFNDEMTWFKGLTKVGLYYEGFVDNLEEVLEDHRRCTMTSYGTRNSKKSNELQIEGNKENDKDCILVQV